VLRYIVVLYLLIGVGNLCVADSPVSLEKQLQTLQDEIGTVESRRLRAIEDLNNNFFEAYQKGIVLEVPEVRVESLRENEATIRLVFEWHLTDGVVDDLMVTLSRYFNATNSNADPEFYAHMNYPLDEHSEIHDSLKRFMMSRGLGLRVKFMDRVEDLYIFTLPGIYPKGQKLWIEVDVDRNEVKGSPPVQVEVKQYDSVPCRGMACWETSWRLRE